MVRHRGKKALYEVIGKKRPKSSYGKILERLHSEKTDKDELTADSAVPWPERAAQWPKRPRAIQFNAGRVEISMPYQLAIALILGIILLIVVAFRLGQGTKSPQGIIAPDAEPTIKTNHSGSKAVNLSAVEAKKPTAAAGKSTGNNRIVIQTYQLRTQLEPVKDYFARAGIETEIRKIGDWYYLVTKNKYENPKRQGTDGYSAKQKIIELGAEYKAPQGYKSFGPKPFHDAYGMKFDD